MLIAFAWNGHCGPSLTSKFLCSCLPFSQFTYHLLFLFLFWQSGNFRALNVMERQGRIWGQRWTRRKKKGELGLYLVMSKTALICSETLQRKKNYSRGGETGKLPTLKKIKDKTFRSFYFLPSSIAPRVCLSFCCSLEVNKGVNENKQLDTVTKIWLAIWVTSTGYFCPFWLLCNTCWHCEIFFPDVACAVC